MLILEIEFINALIRFDCLVDHRGGTRWGGIYKFKRNNGVAKKYQEYVTESLAEPAGNSGNVELEG